jgi:hypothetical protein
MPDLFNYAGEANRNDIRLSDPTQLRGGGGSVDVTALPAGVASISFLGSVAVAASADVSLTGLASAAQLGSLQILAAALMAPAGVSAASALGAVTVSVAVNVTVSVTGLDATTAPGTADVFGTGLVIPAGVDAFSTVGTATIEGATEPPVTVSSGGGWLRFWTPRQDDPPPARSVNVVVFVTGCPSASALGTVTVTATANVTVATRGTRSAVGTTANRGGCVLRLASVSARTRTGTPRPRTVQNLRDDELIALVESALLIR